MRGYGPEPLCTERYRGIPFRLRRSKLRLEIALEDEFVAPTVERISHATGQAQLSGSDAFILDGDEQFGRWSHPARPGR